MALEEGDEEVQIETAHIFVNDFMYRIHQSDVEIDPEILSAVMMKKAGEILLEKHKDNFFDYHTAVTTNFKNVNDLFHKKV